MLLRNIFSSLSYGRLTGSKPPCDQNLFSSQGNRRNALTGRRKGLCKNLTQGKEASHVRQNLRKRKRMNEPLYVRLTLKNYVHVK